MNQDQNKYNNKVNNDFSNNNLLQNDQSNVYQFTEQNQITEQNQNFNNINSKPKKKLGMSFYIFIIVLPIVILSLIIMFVFLKKRESFKDPFEDLQSVVSNQNSNLILTDEEIKNNSVFTCYELEDDGEILMLTQVKVAFDNNDQLNEMYFKGTYKIKNYDKKNPIFIFTQKLVTGLLYAMEKEYEETFKYVDTIIKESPDIYSVTFKITKNHYDALKSLSEPSSDNKLEIIKSIQNLDEDYICKYE